MSRKPTHLPDGTRISDHVTLGVLTATVPVELIDAVLTDTGRQSRRQRQLPARLGDTAACGITPIPASARARAASKSSMP
jgi:hypothetical protein